MQHDEQEMWRKRMVRLLRVFAPFTILLVGLLLLNLSIDEATFFQQSPTKDAALVIERPTEIATGSPAPDGSHRKPIATAVAYATESPTRITEATASPIPTLLPGAIATLTGPPAGSRFSLSSPLAFYWYPASQLAEDHVFALFIEGDDGEELLGVLSEPNLGTGYQVHIDPESIGLSAAEYQWQVRLQQQNGDVLLGSSEKRSLNLVEAKK